MFICCILNGERTSLWDMNGGTWSYGEDKNELFLLADLADKLPLAITVESKSGDIGISHAQPPSLDWDDAKMPDFRSQEIMIWARTWIADKNMQDVANITRTYHGHTPVNEPLTIGNVNFIDTGAVFKGGNLTCVIL